MSQFEKAVRGGLGASLVGVVVVALAPLESPLRTLGGVLLMLGWLACAWGLHRFGRSG